jgi:hypothetical protein
MRLLLGERNDLRPSANVQKVAQAEAAKILNVSVHTVASAAAIRKLATAPNECEIGKCV